MCAPKNKLAKIALVGAAAYATGGGSTLFTSASQAFQAASTAVKTSSTLNTLFNAARVAAPFIGASGQMYMGFLQAQQMQAKAGFTMFQGKMETESYALRKIKRLRALRAKIGEQRALYSAAGIKMEGTPGQILGQTAANFAEDQFTDTFNTSQSILSKKFSAESYKHEAKISLLGGMTNAAITLGTRGEIPKNTEPVEYSTTRPSGLK
jgi:hypothetical protein